MSRSVEERAKICIEGLRKLQKDRGAMAELRRGFSEATEPYAWPYLARWCVLDHERERVITQAVAAAYATHPEETGNTNLLEWDGFRGGGVLMSYLTRILVDKKTAAQRRLADSYAWHKAFWQAFPKRAQRNFLTRTEDQEDLYCVYIVSDEKPEPLGWGVWQTKEIKPSFFEHGCYQFRLCANPTFKRKSDGPPFIWSMDAWRWMTPA